MAAVAKHGVLRRALGRRGLGGQAKGIPTRAVLPRDWPVEAGEPLPCLAEPSVSLGQLQCVRKQGFRKRGCLVPSPVVYLHVGGCFLALALVSHVVPDKHEIPVPMQQRAEGTERAGGVGPCQNVPLALQGCPKSGA